MQIKYIEMPAACQPYKMSIWERMFTSSMYNDENCIAIARQEDTKLYKKSKILVMI